MKLRLPIWGRQKPRRIFPSADDKILYVNGLFATRVKTETPFHPYYWL
jgi:hypothetical protein